MKFKNFKVEDENDNDNAEFTSKRSFGFKFKLKSFEQKFQGTTQSLGNFISKKLHSNDQAKNTENDDVFQVPIKTVNKISTSVTSTSQTTSVNNGNGLELHTLFEPKEVITVTPVEVQSQLNFDDIFELPSSIVNDEDFTKSFSDNHYVTSSEKLTSEHKQQSNNETLTTIPVELLSVVEQTDNPSKTLSTLSSSINNNGNTEKSDEFGVLETISFDQDLEEPAKIISFHLTSTSSTTPSSNTGIAQKLTSKESQNSDIITTINKNDKILYSTTANVTNQLLTVKTNSYDAEQSTESSLTTFLDMKLLQTDLTNSNYEENTTVVSHHSTHDGRVTVISESELNVLNFTDSKLGTWPELTSKILDESMPKLSSVTDEPLGGLPSKVLVDENMAISNTGLKATATLMEGNKGSKELQNILITTNKMHEETQVKSNTNGEEVTSNEFFTGSELTSALAKEHGNLSTQIISKTSFKLSSNVENVPLIFQNTYRTFNYFKMKKIIDENMIPTQPLLATEEDILSNILETTHYPFISNKFKITTDEDMILQDVEKTIVSNFEVNTESSTHQKNTTAEKVENIFMTKTNVQERIQLNGSANGDVVSEFTTIQTHTDENKDSLTSNQLLTSSELTTMAENFPSILKINDGSAITLSTLSKEHDVPTQIIGKIYEVTGNVEKNTRDRFNQFMIKKTTNEDMVSSVPLLTTEIESLSHVLKTSHNPFIENNFKTTTDENMILHELEKTIVSNFEENTESSTVSTLITLHEKDTTAETVENILITKSDVKEGTQLKGSTNGDVVSEVLESSTYQSHIEENKDSLTSNELLTSSELNTMTDYFPSNLKPKDETTITLSTFSKEHDNVPTQIIGKIYEVTGNVEKNTRNRFNQFMIKKTTNEDMVSSVPLLATEIESLSHVLKTTHNPFIENNLKTTTNENMNLLELEKTIVSNFEGNTESSTVSALITFDEKDITAETVENTFMTKNDVKEGTQLKGSTNGDLVSETLEFSTYQSHIEENKDSLTSNEILTSSEITTMSTNFPSILKINEGSTITLSTLSKEHHNVPTQIIGKIYEVTGNAEKNTRDRFNQFIMKKTTNEDMVSSVPLLATEIESVSHDLKTTHNPFIENNLKTTADENLILYELEKTIASNLELNAESSTVSALVTLDETDTTEEKFENILMTKSNSQEGTQFSKIAIGDAVSKELEITTIKTQIDENKDLLTSNELLTSFEATSISDHFSSNLKITDGTTITSATLFQAHSKTSEFTEDVEKATRDRFNEVMLKKTTNEDMVSIEPLLTTEIKSLSQVLQTTDNSFIENKLKTTTDENKISQELEKTIVSNFELNTELSTVSAHITAEKSEIILMTKSNSQEGTQLNKGANGDVVSEELKFTTSRTHTDENTDSLTSNELLTSINDNFSSNLTIKDETAITLSILSKEHDSGLTQFIDKTSGVTGKVDKTTRDRFNELMQKKTTNEDMVASQPGLTTEAKSLSQGLEPTHNSFIGNKLKVTTDENIILKEPEKVISSAGNIESLTTSSHVSQITTATETSVKLPEENQFQESTNKKGETEFVAVTTKIENESQVWPDLTTRVEIAPHILTKTTIGLFNEFQFKDTTANEEPMEPHSATTLTNLPQILKTTEDIFVVNQLTKTTHENMLSKEAELTTTMEGTISNLLITSQNINTSETKETTNIYIEGNKEPSVTLNALPTSIKEITKSENLEHTVTYETHFKENADLISKEEDMNVAAKLKGEYTNTMEVIPHISKTTNSLLKNFLVERTTDEDMIVQEPEKTSFQENIELPTESEHALETITVKSLPNIDIATTKLSEENQFQETTNKFSENKVLPDLTTTAEISSHHLTETTKNLFQEFQLEETTVNEDMTPIESRSTIIFTNLPNIFESTSKLFEEITNEDMLSKETELSRFTTTMEENNELLTSNVPITAEKIDTSEAKETSNTLDMFSKDSELHSIVTNVEVNKESSTILNELLTLTEKPTESKNLENIPATTELTNNIQFKDSSTTNMVSEVPEITEKTAYNIFKIFEPQGSTDEDMAIIEPSILPEITKITPNEFLEDELKQTTNNEDTSSDDFKVITSTIYAVENESSTNAKSETETLPILSSNIPNAPNIVTEPHEIIDQNKFKSKATEEFSDLTISSKIILNTHTIGIGTLVENLPHSPTTIHADLVSSKFTDLVKTLEPNTDNLSKTTHHIDFSSTYSDNNLGISHKTNAYTGTTKESSNLNKEHSLLSTHETNSELTLLSSSNPFPEHNRTFIDFGELTTKSYGNENGDWVTWPEMNSTSEKNTASTLITKLTISDLLTTESSTANEVTEIFQDVIALSTKSVESSSETFPTLPDELQLDFNQTPIEHSTNLSTIEISFVSTITPLMVKTTLTSEGLHFKNKTNTILTNYMSTVEVGETLHSVLTKDQYTSSSPNLISSTISVKTHEPNADNQLKTTQNSAFRSTHSDNNLEPSAKDKEYLTSHETPSGTKELSGLSKEQLTSTTQSSLLSSSNRLLGKNETFLGFEESTTKSYGNENGDWITWPEINSTSDKNTVSTLLTKFTVSDPLNSEILQFNDVTEIYQDAIALSTTSIESSSQTFLTLPDELQLGFNQTLIEDSTNLLQTTAKDSFESTATTLNINSFSTTERHDLKNITHNILTNYVSPIGIENTLHTFNTKDHINDTDHLSHKPKFEKATVTDIINIKSSGQMTSQFENTLAIPDKIETVVNITSKQQKSSTVTTINPLFSLTEGIINTNNTEAHNTNLMHKPSEITATYTSILLNPTHVEHLSHSENLRTESGNTLTSMISDEITQSNQVSIGSTLANQNYQTEQHDTNLMHNSDESSETHTSTLVKSEENSVILSHNQPLQQHFSTTGTHRKTTSTFDRKTSIIHTTPSGDELLMSQTEHKSLNSENILAKQSEIIQNSHTTHGLDQGMVSNQIIHSVNTENQPVRTENAHSEFPESGHTPPRSEQETSINELTHFINTETQPLIIANAHSEFAENSHTTLTSEEGISLNGLTHSVSTENQSLTTVNIHPEFTESSHRTVSAEEGILPDELTHLVNTDNKLLTTVNTHPHLPESDHTIPNAEQRISHNEFTHSINIEYQSPATANEHLHLSENGHSTISAEHELSHSALTHSVHTESQSQTTLNENLEFSESSHITLSSEHGISINEFAHPHLPQSDHTTPNAQDLPENGHPTTSVEHELSHIELTHSSVHAQSQPLTTVNENIEFSESSHITFSSEHGISINELTHSANTENQPITTVESQPHLPESDYTTTNAEQGISHDELAHSINVDYQSQATTNEHIHLPENGHLTISAEHELSHNELTHSVHTETQPLTTLKENLEFLESSHVTLSSEHETSITALTHSANTENQPPTTVDALPHLPENGHLTTSVEHELSHNELTHSVHTESKPLTTVNENIEFSKSSHITVSSEHGMSITELTHSANTENRPPTTINEHPHLSENDHTTHDAEQGISPNELTHSINTDYQSQATTNEHPHVAENGHPTISAEHELSHNELIHSVHTELQPLTTLNNNVEFSESSHITLSSEHGTSITELTHLANTENQPPTTVNEHPHLPESDHTTHDAEQGISHNELTHSINIDYQSQATADEHLHLPENGHPSTSVEQELSHNELTHSVHIETQPLTTLSENLEYLESSHITLSLEHGISINELTHSANTENQPITTVEAQPHLPESDYTTPNVEQEISHNELTHLINIDYQSQATENEHPHLPENGHPTTSVEHELSHNELTHSVHTETQPLTTLNENLEFFESSHITLSSEHRTSNTEITHSANTENQPSTTVDEHPHLLESDHTTHDAEQGISHNELTHSINIDYQSQATANEHPHLPENGHPTTSIEHELSHNELTHSVHTESQPLTTGNENIEFSESSHITLSTEHGMSITELTHSANTENQLITTVEAPHLPESVHTTPNAEQGISHDELAHSINNHYQSQATTNEHTHLPENGLLTISAEHELSYNELTHSVHTETQPLTTLNENLEFFESSHITLSSEHRTSNTEITHSANTENQPSTTVDEHPHLLESDHTTHDAEQGISHNELTHSINIDYQSQATANEHPHLPENGHPTTSIEHELSHNELTHSVHTESQPLTTGNENIEFSESSHITLSTEHGMSITELTHSANTENQLITTVEAPHLPESVHTTPNAEQGISHDELAHSINNHYQSQATTNEHTHLPENGLLTISAEHELSHNELTHSVDTETQPLTTLNENLEFFESSHITLSSEHGTSNTELTHSANTENQLITTVEAPHLPESVHTTPNAEQGISHDELAHSINNHYQSQATTNEHTHLPENGHLTISAEHELSHNELTHSVHTESQPLTTGNENIEFSESSHITLSSEHGTSNTELTHSANTENQLITTVEAQPHLPESVHITPNVEQEVSLNELTHLVNTEHQTPTTENKHPHLSESGHTTISIEHELPHNELTYSIHTENHHLTNVKEHTEFSESSHTTLSSEHEISINELTHPANTDNQLLSPVSVHPHLPGSSNTSLNAEQRLSPNELTHSVNAEQQTPATNNEHPHMSESGHTAINAEHEPSHKELTHSVHTENHHMTNVKEHTEFSESGHTTLSVEHGISINVLTHLVNTENQPLTNINAHPYVSVSGHTTVSGDYGVSSNAVTHSVNTENQPLTTVNAHPHLSEIGHPTISAEHEISHNELTHSLNTENDLLTTVNEHSEISEKSHTTLSLEHGISINELTPSANTENQPLSTENAHSHLLESSYTTLSAEHELSTNEFTHSIEVSHLPNTETQSLPSVHTDLQISDNTPINTTLTDHSQYIHATLPAELEISDNETSYSSTFTDGEVLKSTEFTILEDITKHSEINQSDHTTTVPKLEILDEELIQFPSKTLTENTTYHTRLSTLPEISQNVHNISHANLAITSTELPYLLNTTSQLLSPETTEYQITDNLHTSFSSTPIISNADTGVVNSAEITVFEDITKHSETSEIDHTTDIPKLEILDEELIQLPSKPLAKNTAYHTEPSILSDVNQNIHTTSHADLGITSSELPYLLNTSTQLLSSETTVSLYSDDLHTSLSSTSIIIHESTLNDINQNIHTTSHADLGISSNDLSHLVNTSTSLLSTETIEHHIADNLHTSFGSTNIIHGLTSNDTDQNIHTTSHADLGISSSELPHQLNTATQLLSTEAAEHQITDNLHTSFSSTPIISNADTGVVNSAEITVFEDITKHSETSEIDHTADIPKLEILDEELIQLPSKMLTESTAYHTEPSELSDNNQTKHTNFHADLGITNSELPYLVNTSTTLFSSETTESQVADNLHTSLSSIPIIHDSTLNDIDQNIHTTSHADLGISSNELSHLVNTATTLLSTESIEHHIADDLHTSLGSTPIIIHDSTSNYIDQNIHTTSHADLSISSNNISHLVNTATTLLSTESIEHHIADDLHTSLGSTPIIIHDSTLNNIDQNIHTTFHEDLGISSNEISHLVNTATTLLSTETIEHHIADDLHTSLDSTPIVIHGSASSDIDQNIHTTSHADLGISSNEISHLVNIATTLLSTETIEHHIADDLHTSLGSTPIVIHGSASSDIDQDVHTTFHADLETSSSELQHLSNVTTQILPNENADQIPDNMHTSSITPTTSIFHSTESGQVITNTEQGVLSSTEFTVFENITKHSASNQIDHTTGIPKLEILDEELIHLPSILSTDHLETSGNELSRRSSIITKPLTSQNIVTLTSDNIPIGITIPSTLIVQNTGNEANSNTQDKFTHLTEDLAKHSEIAHSNHNTLISTLGITSHDLLNTEYQQISDHHSSLVELSTTIIPGAGNESKFFNTDKEFYNSTEFSVFEDLAKHLETTQINQTTVVPKLEILDEEFIQIPNKSILLTENVNQITNHTDLTTLPVTFSEFIPLPTITLFEQIFSDFIHNNTSNYTKPEEEKLTTERLKSTLVDVSNQNLNVSSNVSSILTTNTNFITNAFSHKETNSQFLKTRSTDSEFQTLEFSHSTESFKENLKSFHKWLGQPSVNGTDQTNMLPNANESTLSVKTNSDMEVSTNDLKHFSTLLHSTVSYLPSITNEDIFHTSQHHLGTETNEPTIFTSHGAQEHQSNSNPENLNPNQQGLDQNQTLLPVITTSTVAYSQNYHNENFTTNEELPHVNVSQEMRSFEITTLLPLVATTSTLAYSHNYHPDDFSVNEELPHVSVSHVTTFPSSIISTETSTAKLETSPHLSTMHSSTFYNKFLSTEVHNLGNFLNTDQAGNIKNDTRASSTEVSEIPTHESIDNLSKPQNKTFGDTFHSNNKNIDNNCSETSSLTINNLKTTGKDFEKNSTEGMWQWPGLGPETSISFSNYLAGDHAKITQPVVTIANSKFEPADNEILFTAKPNLSVTALEHESISPNLVTHVTHPKLQPEMNKNIPPVEILAGQHNATVENSNVHQSNGKLQNAPIYINLPVYPVDSTYPLLIKFNEYYSSTTKSSIIIDDEATDKVINTEQFRTMKFEDFNAVTEFPSTTVEMEEPAISKLINTNQISSNSIQPTTALNQALKTDHIESNQQSVELTTTSEVTHVGKSQDKLSNATNESTHQNQQNAELTTKSETVNISSTEEKINQNISTGVTEVPTLGSSLSVTHIEITSCTSSNTLSKEIGLEDINKTTEASVLNAHSQPVMIINEFPKFQEESTCNYTDYVSQNNCMCSMDNLIKDLRMKLVNNFLNFSIDNFTCPIFTHVEAGIFLGNDSVPQISKSRRDVVSDMYSIVVRREIVDYQNMDRTLNEQLELKNTENDIFATPGMKILIPCISTNNLSEGSTNYSWTFSDNLPLTEGKIQETEGTLTIDNVAPQDAGNYTCIATSSNANKSDEKRYEHHLSVVSIPSYRLQTTLLYNSTEKCQSGDADIISLYLPHSLEGLICGNYFKVCSIEVKNPKCLNATQYTSVNLTVIIEPINVIMPAINNSVCDVGCEMKIYTHVVLFIIKNLEAVLKLPVFFRLSYRQQKLMPTEVVVKKTRQKLGTEAPKLIITCPPGFGYYKKTHVCGTCGRNTFSRGDETFCSPCPAGQYQPMVGSKSCLICATPLQDPYCLRVMYSNTHKFRVLIGITATVLVVLIILLLCIKSMKKSTNSRSNSKFGRESYLKNRRQSKRRSREPDCEMQDSQPLLDSSRDRKYKGYNRKPPEPPPPDFY